jgi:hypothetical protein
MINTIIALVIWAVLPSNRISDYTRYSLADEDTVKLVSQIKEQSLAINANLAKYRLVEQDLMDESAEGGFISAFDDRQAVRKLIVTYYGETGKAVTEYYFNHNTLLFALIRESHYNKSVTQPGLKITSVYENRCYFNNNKMIRWLQGTIIQKPNTVSYNDEGTKLLSESKRLLNYIPKCTGAPTNISSRSVLQCKYGSACASTGFIIKGSRNSCGEAVHVTPKNKNVPLEL